MADHLRDATKNVDFIFREDAVQCAEDIADDLFDSASDGARIVAKWLKDIPTADVVEVVRRKDCKHYKEGKLLGPTKFCYFYQIGTGLNTADDDFCSRGERRDDK